MRFYLTNTASPLPSLPFVTNSSVAINWEQATTTVRRAFATTPQGANTPISQTETGADNPTDVALGQWVSPPIVTPGTLQGQVEIVAAYQESDLAADMVIKFIVWVVDSAGTVRRGIATSAAGTVELSTTLTGRRVTNTMPTPVACQVGDRIVVEAGVRATNAVTTSFTATMRYGGTDATELASGDTGTNATTRSGYIQFNDPAVDALFIPAQPVTGAGAISPVSTMGAPTVTRGQPKTILMVVGDKTALSGGDPFIKARLENTHGCVVVLASDEEPEFTGFYDGLIVSDSCSAGVIGGKYGTVAKPAIALENGPWSGGWGMSTGGPQLADVTTWNVAQSSALTDNLIGTVTVYAPGTAQNTATTSGLGTGAVVQADVSGSPGNTPYFTYEAGATLTTGSPAPARRVGFGLLNGSVAVLAADGLRLLDAAIRWAFGTVVNAAPAQTLAAAAIPTAEAHGTATVQRGPVQVTGAGAIPSGEAHGTPAVQPGPVTASPGGIPSQEAHGTPAVAPGAVTLAPLGASSAEAFGAAQVSTGPVEVQAVGATSAEDVPAPTVAIGAVELQPGGIPTGQAFGAPALTLGAVLVEPDPIPTAETFGAPRLSARLSAAGAIDSDEEFGTAVVAGGQVIVSPSGIGTAEQHGSPVLNLRIYPPGATTRESFGDPPLLTSRAYADGIETEEAFGSPTLSQRLYAGPTASREAFGVPLVDSGEVGVFAQGIEPEEAFGALEVLVGPVDVEPLGIPAGEAVSAPRVVLIVEPLGIDGQEAAGEPAVSPGQVLVRPSGVEPEEAFGPAEVQPGPVAVVAGSGVPPRAAMGQPQVQPEPVEVQPEGQLSAETFGTPALTVARVFVRPPGAAAGEAFGPVTVRVGQVLVQPAGTAPAQAVGQPRLSITVYAGDVAGGEALGEPAVQVAPVRLSPPGIAPAEAFGSPRARAGGVQLEPEPIPPRAATGRPRVVYVIRPAGVTSVEAHGSPELGRPPLSPPVVGAPTAEDLVVLGAGFFEPLAVVGQPAPL